MFVRSKILMFLWSNNKIRQETKHDTRCELALHTGRDVFTSPAQQTRRAAAGHQRPKHLRKKKHLLLHKWRHKVRTETATKKQKREGRKHRRGGMLDDNLLDQRSERSCSRCGHPQSQCGWKGREEGAEGVHHNALQLLLSEKKTSTLPLESHSQVLRQ